MKTSDLESAIIKLRARGQVTLPTALRDALHLQSGDSLRAIKITNAIMLTPLSMDKGMLRIQMRKVMEEHDVTAEDLLRDL